MCNNEISTAAMPLLRLYRSADAGIPKDIFIYISGPVNDCIVFLKVVFLEKKSTFQNLMLLFFFFVVCLFSFSYPLVNTFCYFKSPEETASARFWFFNKVKENRKSRASSYYGSCTMMELNWELSGDR